MDTNVSRILTPDSFVKMVRDGQTEMAKVIVGMKDVLDLSFIALCSDGHMNLVDVPGAGKTTLALALAGILRDGDWAFYQGTADMLPSDIVGSMVLDLETRKLKWQWAVIKPTTNILVADEINRTPPKTQSAQLSFMQERKLGQGGTLTNCADPLLVIATMNPVEQEGVYPMAEAVLDRFAIQVRPGGLSTNEEESLVTRASIFARDQAKAAGLQPVMTPADLIAMREYAQSLPVSPAVVSYIVRLVRSTRVGRTEEAAYLSKDDAELIQLGAGNRGSIWLTATAKAHAALRGGDRVEFQDVQAMAPYVLAHRLSLRPDAKYAASKSLETIEMQIVGRLVNTVPTVAEALPKVIETAESAAEGDTNSEFESLDLSVRPVNNRRKSWRTLWM